MGKNFKITFFGAIILAVIVATAVYIFRGGLFWDELSLIDKNRATMITEKSEAAKNYLSDKYESEFTFVEEKDVEKNDSGMLSVNYIFTDSSGKEYIVTYLVNENKQIIIGENTSP